MTNKKYINLTRGHIDQRFTFDTYVEDHLNELPVYLFKEIAKKSEKPPKFIYMHGNIGVGKSHLIFALTNALITQESIKVTCMNAERFATGFIKAKKHKSISEFRELYHHADILIIDNIEFIAGKKEIEEELLHTCKILQATQKRIIIVAGHHPFQIRNLDERLYLYFKSAFMLEVNMPSFESRIKILKRNFSMPVDKKVLYLLSTKLHSTVRELVGSAVKLNAYAHFTGETLIDIDLATKVLKKQLSDKPCPYCGK